MKNHTVHELKEDIELLNFRLSGKTNLTKFDLGILSDIRDNINRILTTNSKKRKVKNEH